MHILEVINGRVLIDKSFLPVAERYKWFIDRDGYATTFVTDNGKVQVIRMHQLVIGRAPEGLVCDHINTVRLDNRSQNLRHATPKENRHNRNGHVDRSLIVFTDHDLRYKFKPSNIKERTLKVLEYV